MEDMPAYDRIEGEALACRIEMRSPTPEDLSLVLSLIEDRGGPRRRQDREPRLDSADDFEAWVVIPGEGGLNAIHMGQSGDEHVVGFEPFAAGRGHGCGRTIGAAMWAAFVRSTMCPEIDEAPTPDAPRVMLVGHHYASSTQSTMVQAPFGFNVHRTAAYIQLACEEWHDEGAVLLPQTIVEALIRFYGCSPALADARPGPDDEVDMYLERERFCGDFALLMGDPSLERAGLAEFLEGRYEA